MKFIDRDEELARLDRLARGRDGGLAVVTGRRRIGKTRLLLEWVARHGGVYTVADQSSPGIQRRYVAAALGARFPGFADVGYPDWYALFRRLAREAAQAGWRGPFVLDELPYLVAASGELPSVLQRWIDHEAKEAGLVVAVAGSSQRMMQGLVLDRDAPLFGRAREFLDLGPIDPSYLRVAFRPLRAAPLVETYAAWGGVPRYWELACDEEGSTREKIARLVLDPLGPLHREPDRLLVEEIPSALEVRPILDAIGAGAHRVAEIAGRAGRPMTSMARPLKRLLEMGLVLRETPFGSSEHKGRLSLYRLDDPFFRLWFRMVAPHRAMLASASPRARVALLDKYWSGLVGAAWEELCRKRVPALPDSTPLGKLGPWGPVSRWWMGHEPEWDIVSESADGRRLLLGEAKWCATPLRKTGLAAEAGRLARRPPPTLPARYGRHELVRALFVPQAPAGRPGTAEVLVVGADEVLG